MRYLIYRSIAALLILVGVVGFVVPSLVSSRDSGGVIAGIILLLVSGAFLVEYSISTYKFFKETK